MASLEDGELLDRFLDRNDPMSTAAIDTLVARHSAMVWRACYAATNDDASAADAFQATFLILLQRATAIRRRDSVAGWLGGVARCVGAKARAASARRRVVEQEAARRSATATPPAAGADRDDLAEAVRTELNRLSDQDHAVVLACDLDGLTETEAARRLGCPVGTIRSRLHRARGRLRRRLAARGLDPSTALGLLTPSVLPADLVRRTAALAVRCGPGAVGWASTSPVAVATLIRQSSRSLPMLSLLTMGSLLVTVTTLVSMPGSEPAADLAQTPTPAAAPGVSNRAKPGDPKTQDLAERFQQLKRAFDRAELGFLASPASGPSMFGESKEPVGQPTPPSPQPDEVRYARDMIALASLDPKSLAARDAAIWVMDLDITHDVKPMEHGLIAPEFGAAVELLLAHHADDPEVVRVGLDLDGRIDRRRDAFVEGCYALARGHEAKGLARLAYAQYLDRKRGLVLDARNSLKRQEFQYITVDATGKTGIAPGTESDEEFAYKVGLRRIDPDALRAEAERLYREVIKEYADDRYIDRRYRQTEAGLAEPLRADGSKRSEEERQRLQKYIEIRGKTTLAQVASAHLRELNPFVMGETAPEVLGKDLVTGEPVRLAEHRGRPVLLLFWGESADLGFVHRLKLGVDRMRRDGRPVAVIGLFKSDDAGAARGVVEREQLPWRNVLDGDKGYWGPIGKAYHGPLLPTAIPIDSGGKVIRSHVDAVEIDQVLDEMAASATTRPPG